MRIGLVGLSTPVAYDYGVEATRARADMVSSPNPILDSPFGLMLLYDELWFLCRSLCPENMRGCSFVRFLDEEGMLPGDELDRSQFRRDWERRAGTFEFPPRIPASWDAKWDNHSHSLDLGCGQFAGNAGDPSLILLDLEIASSLDVNGLELVGNRFGQGWIEDLHPNVRRQDLAHVLTIDYVPNYLTPEGPYHPVIDEVREDRFLKDFRRWVAETAETSVDEAEAIKDQVERGLRAAQREVFLDHLDRRTHFTSIGKTMTATVADLVVPGVGTGAQLIQEVREARRISGDRWQGFLVSMEAKTEQ